MIILAPDHLPTGNPPREKYQTLHAGSIMRWYGYLDPKPRALNRLRVTVMVNVSGDPAAGNVVSKEFVATIYVRDKFSSVSIQNVPWISDKNGIKFRRYFSGYHTFGIFFHPIPLPLLLILVVEKVEVQIIHCMSWYQYETRTR